MKVAFETHGCRSNSADTEELVTSCLEKGYIPTGFDDTADVYVLNSCSVTNTADNEALRRLKKVRALNPSAKIVMTGCFAEVGAERISTELPDVSIIGPGRKSELISVIESDSITCSSFHSGNQSKSERRGRFSESLGQPVSSYTPEPGSELGGMVSKSRFHLRIQEGCSEYCTYCIIPQTRGALVSKSIENIQKDLNLLDEKGYGEVVLTGTHIGGYGEDSGSSLQELLQKLKTPSRLRLTSIDPNDINKEIIELLTISKQFCNHLHICVQSTSDRLLKLMNRRYDFDLLKEITESFKAKNPHFCLGADLITGFPGETAKEFEQSLDRVSELKLDYLHVFPYSERENTAAAKLEDGLDIKIRKKRAKALREVASTRKVSFLRSLVGKELDIVVERQNRGTSSEFAKVFWDNTFAASDHKFGSRITGTVSGVIEKYEGVVCRL